MGIVQCDARTIPKTRMPRLPLRLRKVRVSIENSNLVVSPNAAISLICEGKALPISDTSIRLLSDDERNRAKGDLRTRSQRGYDDVNISGGYSELLEIMSNIPFTCAKEAVRSLRA